MEEKLNRVTISYSIGNHGCNILGYKGNTVNSNASGKKQHLMRGELENLTREIYCNIITGGLMSR